MECFLFASGFLHGDTRAWPAAGCEALHRALPPPSGKDGQSPASETASVQPPVPPIRGYHDGACIAPGNVNLHLGGGTGWGATDSYLKASLPCVFSLCTGAGTVDHCLKETTHLFLGKPAGLWNFTWSTDLELAFWNFQLFSTNFCYQLLVPQPLFELSGKNGKLLQRSHLEDTRTASERRTVFSQWLQASLVGKAFLGS